MLLNIKNMYKLQLAIGIIIATWTMLIIHLVSTQNFFWLWAAIPVCIVGLPPLTLGLLGLLGFIPEKKKS
jgi:hypothetical protein